jgi:plasmid stability protein
MQGPTQHVVRPTANPFLSASVVVRYRLDHNALNAYNANNLFEEESMAVLNIRNLPNDVHARLRIRAAKAGRSMEAEARAILIEACKMENGIFTPSVLQAWVDQLYGYQKPANVVDDLIEERRQEAVIE